MQCGITKAFMTSTGITKENEIDLDQDKIK